MSEFSRYNTRFNGTSWESMMQMLLLHEDYQVKAFSRLGKDNGIDAISGNGQIVYQAKYHENPSISKCIADLQSEMGKIGEYKETLEYWKPVKKWVLFTNIEENPNDRQKWDEAVKECNCHGLEVELWNWTAIWNLLEKYPEVKKEYIEDEVRCFLLEREFLEINCNSYLPEAYDIECVGRENELREFDEFLSSGKKIWAVSGPGGMGKSRFLLECAKRVDRNNRNVFFGIPQVMKASSSWTKRLVFEHPSILFIDELSDLGLLKMIIGVLSSEAKKWKVVFSERNADAQTIKELNLPRYESFRKDTSGLSRLNYQNRKLFSERLLDVVETSRNIKFKDKEKVAHVICTTSQGIPLWICLSLKSILQNNGSIGDDFEKNAVTLYEKYTESIIPNLDDNLISKVQYDAILKWCSLYKELSLKQAKLIDFICLKANVDKPILVKTFQVMTRNGLMQNYGYENKTYSICPDVIREYILKDRLLFDQNLSNWGEEVVDGLINNDIPFPTAVVASLSHIENSLSEKEPVDVLGAFTDALKKKFETSDIDNHRQLWDLVEKLCASKTKEILEIVNVQLNKYLAYKDVYNCLWMNYIKIRDILQDCLYYCEDYSSRQLCLENILILCKTGHLSIVENQVLGSVLNPIFEGELRNAYKENVDEVLSNCFGVIENDGSSNVDYYILKCFLDGCFAVKYNASVCFNGTLSFRQGYLRLDAVSDSFKWVQRIQNTLEKNVLPEELSRILIDCYGKIFHEVLHYPSYYLNQDTKKIKEEFISKQLQWTASFISSGQGLDSKTRNHMREVIWSWLLEYGKEYDSWELAKKCEAAYCLNKTDEDILSYINMQYDENEKEIRADLIKKHLLDKEEKQVIAFVDKLAFYTTHDFYRINNIAFEYGQSLQNKDFIISITQQLAQRSSNKIFEQFYLSVINGIVSKQSDVDSAIIFIRIFLKQGLDILDVLSSCLGEKRFFCINTYNLVKEAVLDKDINKYVLLMSRFTLNMPQDFLNEIDSLWSKWSDLNKKIFLGRLLNDAYASASGWSQNSFEWNEFASNWIIEKIARTEKLDSFANEIPHFEKQKSLFSTRKNIQWLYSVFLFRKDRGYHLSHDFSLTYFVKSNFDENERNAFANIIDLILSWQSSRIKKDIALLDPENKCVGQIVANKFKSAKTEKEKLAFAGIAGYFRDDSSAWSEISAIVCEYARRLPDKQKKQFWQELEWNDPEVVCGAYGQVAKNYYDDVEHFEKMLKEEHLEAKKEYWASRLDDAQNVLKDAEERAKVQRGE